MEHIDYEEYEEDSDNEIWMNNDKTSIWDYYKSAIKKLKEIIYKLRKENRKLKDFIKSLPEKLDPIILETTPPCNIM